MIMHALEQPSLRYGAIAGTASLPLDEASYDAEAPARINGVAASFDCAAIPYLTSTCSLPDERATSDATAPSHLRVQHGASECCRSLGLGELCDTLNSNLDRHPPPNPVPHAHGSHRPPASCLHPRRHSDGRSAQSGDCVVADTT